MYYYGIIVLWLGTIVTLSHVMLGRCTVQYSGTVCIILYHRGILQVDTTCPTRCYRVSERRARTWRQDAQPVRSYATRTFPCALSSGAYLRFEAAWRAGTGPRFVHTKKERTRGHRKYFNVLNNSTVQYTVQVCYRVQYDTSLPNP